MLPFSREQFFELFGAYNRAVFPSQIGLLLIALLCLAVAIRPREAGGRWIAGGLALLWLWIGVVYHLVFFTRINPAAYLFGFLFVMQGAAFAWLATRKEPPVFRFEGDLRGVVGGFLVLYALVLYPLVGALAGHQYMESPTFGLPCPTTIFTFGVLLWARSRIPGWLLVVPALWCLVGGSAALLLGVPQDLMLPVAGVIGTVLIVLAARGLPRSAPGAAVRT